MASKVRIGGEVRDLLDELKKVERENLRIRKSYQDIAKESRDVNRIAKRAFRSTRTESEKFKLELKDLRRALKAGALDTDTYRRAADKLKNEFRDLREEQDDTAEAQDNIFSEELIGRVGSFATRLSGVSVLVGALFKGFQEARQEAERLASVQLEGLETRGRLAQVSETPQEFRELTQLAEELRRSGAARTIAQAERIVFALDSSGLKDSFEFFQRILKARFEPNVEGLIGAIEKQTTNFGLTPEQAVDQGLIASGITQNELAEVLRAAAGPAQAAQAVGLGSAQNLALVATLSKTAESLEQGRTQALRLLETIDKEGIRGDNLLNILEGIQQRIDAGESERDIFTETRALQGFRALVSNIETFRSAVEAIRDAQGETRERLSFVEGDVGASAALTRQTEQGRAEVANELIGVQENLRESIIQLRDTIQAELGRNAIFRGVDRSFFGFLGRLGIDRALTNQFDIAGLRALARAQGRDDLIDELDRLEALNEANKQVDRGIRPTVPIPEAD